MSYEYYIMLKQWELVLFLLTIQWLTFIHIISNHQAGKSTACSSYSRLFLQLALSYVSDLVHSPCKQDGDRDEALPTVVEHEAFPFSRPPSYTHRCRTRLTPVDLTFHFKCPPVLLTSFQCKCNPAMQWSNSCQHP
uniref:Uncharacterized protein n=1 Tax=Aegilops tauschii subsp. strangulata TaxID=200361 RepID=A0A453AT12_AEGTS